MRKELNKIRISNCYIHYLIVTVLFMLAFIFGKNMNVLTPEQQKLQEQSYVQRKMALGVYNVSIDQRGYRIDNKVFVKNGQCGRVFFGLKNTSAYDDSSNILSGSPNIQIRLSNDFDQSQALGSYEIKSNRFVQTEEVNFCADADYSDLVFRKDENSQYSSFEISNISFYPLSLGKHNFDNLESSVLGNSDFSEVIYRSQIDLKSATKPFRFTRKNQMIGQTFVADSESISGVDMKLEFTGVGGVGSYFLELREVIDQNGKSELSSDRIAYYMFNKDSVDQELNLGENIYHIPLAGQLERGKTYYIGVNNNAVKFNILNTLKIYGGSADNNGNIITSVKGKSSEKSGSLYLKAYGADYVQVGGEKVLTGAKILDSGDGTGLYFYEQRGNFSDYLDIDQLISKNKSSIFYDNFQKGISAKDEGDNAFTYKINTVYPFNKIKIEAGQPGGEFTDSLIFYSFDNTNWTEIKNDWNKEDSLFLADNNKFQELIQGDGKIKTVFVKVTYDKDDVKEKATSATQIHLFGLKNLKILAELKIK